MLSVAFDCLLKMFLFQSGELKNNTGYQTTCLHKLQTVFLSQKLVFQVVKHQTCEVLKVHIPFLHSIFTLAPDLSFDCLCILDLHKKYGLFCSLVVARSILLNVKLAPEILHEAFGFWVSFCFKLLVYSVLLIKAKEIMVNKLCKNLFVCSLLEQVNHTQQRQLPQKQITQLLYQFPHLTLCPSGLEKVKGTVSQLTLQSLSLFW